MRHSASMRYASMTVAVWLCAVGVATAQYTVGTILGSVTDASGAVVRGAKITVTNTKTGLVRTATSDDSGSYEMLNLPFGNYDATSELAGFKTAEQKDITLNINDRRLVNFQMEVGGKGETITVEANTLQVESENGDVSGLVDGRRVAELPLNGRNFIQLTSLQPGTVTNGVFFGSGALNDPTTVFYGKLATTSVNGARQNGSNWLVDGGNNVDPGANWTINNLPSIDSIQEFKILSSNYTAEFGRSGGGQVNLVTKSGGTEYHGALWEFFRNDVLDARNFFTKAIDASGNPVPKLPLRFNTFGFNVGGPIIPNNNWKSRLNFFANFEWLRVRTQSAVTAQVPTEDERAGIFPAGLTNLGPGGATCPAGFGPGPTAGTVQIPQSCMDANSLLILGLYPHPNLAGALNFTTGVKGIRNNHQQVYRLDVKANQSTSIFLRYMKDSVFQSKDNGVFSDNIPVSGDFVDWPGENLVANVTSTISAKVLNELQLSRTVDALNRFKTGIYQRKQLPGFSLPVLFPGQKVNSDEAPATGNLPNFTISGIKELNLGAGEPFINYADSYQLSDNVSIESGRHTFKTGLKLAYSRKNEAEAPQGTEDGGFTFDGTFSGNSVADFLLGWAKSYNELATLRRADVRWWDIEPFVQDHLRLGRLSLDVGVRFQYFLQPYEIHNLLRNFDPGLFDPANAPFLITDAGSDLGKFCIAGESSPPPSCPAVTSASPGDVLTATGTTADLFNGIVAAPFQGNRATIKNHFNTIAPRFGFAYDISGRGTTVLRGGYGIFYDRTSTSANTQLVSNPGLTTFEQLNNLTLASFASGSGGTAPRPGPSGVSAYGLEGNIPYLQQWSFGVQHQLIPNTVLDLRYVGSKGTHLDRRYDLNQPPPSSSGNADLLRPFQGFSRSTITDQVANSIYNSLQAQLRGRKGQVNYQISYTWSHSIDNAPGIFFQDGDHQDSHNLAAERGSSDFDVRHNFVANVIWDLPFGQNSHGAAKALVGGWTLTGIYTYQTGVPIYIRVNQDPFNLGCGCFLRPDLVGDPEGPHEFLEWFNTSAFAIPGTPRFGTAGRNLVAGPGVNNLDLATYKNFGTGWLGGKSRLLGETSSFQFRAEFFNIVNHPQFDQVNGNVTDAAFGQITRARTPRQIQFALKFLW